MELKQRAEFGRAAVNAGAVDRAEDGEREAAINTVANILHWLASIGESEPELILSSAATHFFAEREGLWTPVEHDEGVFYLESAGERIGPYSREEAHGDLDHSAVRSEVEAMIAEDRVPTEVLQMLLDNFAPDAGAGEESGGKA